MNHLPDPLHSVNPIRRRLFILLGQAFAAVVILTLVLLLGLFALVITNASRLTQAFTPPMAYVLETYYLTAGSWDGVGKLAYLTPSNNAPEWNTEWNNEWNSMVLMDAEGRILLDHSRTDTARIGQPYVPGVTNFPFPLSVNGSVVGTLVFEQSADLGLGRVFVGLLPPLVVISFFTGLLTLLISLLLMRRVVTPLADVIAAAHSVASGDLSTRVVVRGPGDLRSLSDSFNRMAEALEREDHDRRQLLADIAHELRTPLTVMRGKLEGMVDGIYPADDAHVAPVLEETYVLERLVEDLHLLTLAETRQLHFDLQPIALGELAQNVADVFQAEAEDKHITLQVQVAGNLPTVLADPQRVSQVIGNLISNALRYTPENGAVELAVQANPQTVAITVSDNGPGVSESDLPKLFDRFWRSEKSRARAQGGAGLGLAIARQLIEAQGGHIAAHSRSGGGLVVTFQLPLVNSTDIKNLEHFVLGEITHV